jgi:hypothetical protein
LKPNDFIDASVLEEIEDSGFVKEALRQPNQFPPAVNSSRSRATQAACRLA